MQVQELHEEFLLNLEDRLRFEIEIRYMVYGGRDEENQWLQPMYLIPMWNIVEKVQCFKSYFDELGVIFPTEYVCRHPLDLPDLFPDSMTHIVEEEFIFKGEKVVVKYRRI